MALSPVDFYVYSRATGAPVPEDPEERARMAPEVMEFRRNQLKAPEGELVMAGLRGFGPYKNVNPAELEQRRQELMGEAPRQESSPLAALGAAGVALGALAGIGFGAKRLMRRGAQTQEMPPRSATAGVVKTKLPDQGEAVRRSAASEVPAPSKIAAPTPAVAPATVDIAQQIIDKYADDYAATQEKTELARQRRIVRQMEADDARKEVETQKLARSILSELKAEQKTSAAPFDVDKFLNENEALYRRLVSSEDIKEKRILGAEFLDQLRSGQVPEFEAPSTPLPTRANQPGSFSDLTDIQNQLLNQARNEQTRAQQVNAVEAGEDQVAQRAQRKTMALTGKRAARQEASPALQKLYDAGLDEFEITARINAYAQYGKSEFLDPGYNANTVGAANFARTLDIVQPEFDRAGNLIAGDFAAGQQTVYAGGEKYETLPEGEIRRSAFASQQPRSVRTRSQDEEQWEPISEALTGLTGGVSTAAVPMKQSEQYEQAIDNFRGHWDEGVRSYLAGQPSFITRPARRNRLVDAFDLDLPVRLRNVEGLNEEGQLVTKREAILYRDVLPPDTVAAIERGEQMNLDVPFLVDKNRAIAVAQANPTPENRLDAEHYRMTGRALVRAHQKIVEPFVNDQYIAELSQQPYFQTVENLGGQPNVTPVFGRGSQKGGLVGGTAEAAVREPVYNLYYAPHTTTAGKQMLVNKTSVLDEKGNIGELGITDLSQLDQIGIAKDSTGAELYVSPGQQTEYVMTQPMAVKRPLKQNAPPVAQLRKQGISSKTGQPYDFLSDVYEAAETIVQAPLQVLDAKTGKTISAAGQVKRDQLSGFLKNLRESSGVKDYAELGALANRYLAEQKGITLPVLESPTAFEFIESVIGRPGSRPSRKSFVTVNRQTGDVYPLSREEAQSLGFAGGSVVEPSLSRKYVGPPSLDIRESPKGLEQWARMGESDVDWEELKDFGDEPLGVASLGGLVPRVAGPLQQKLSPATKGPGSELQLLREQLAKIKATQPKVSTEPLPSNLEVVTQQLLAQTGRRAGKRRNR